MKTIRTLVVAFATAMPAVGMAASSENTKTGSLFSNPLFITLLLIILILAIMIVVLGNALSNLAGSDLLSEKIKKHNGANNGPGHQTTTVMILTLVLGLSALPLSAAQTTAALPDVTIGGLEKPAFYTMVITIAAELLVLGILFNTFKNLLSLGQEKKKAIATSAVKQNAILKKLTDTVAIEDEESITLGHEYDGIRELDNNLPPWWKYGFYLTILVAIVYMLNYHVIGVFPLQAEEYQISLKKAEKEVEEYMKNSANNVDESTVKLLIEAHDIASGKELFMNNCAACHGRAGEGTVGPNLTDDYWIHGGSVKDIFKTIKYGWPDKGMKSWKEDFSPMQIAQLTSFLRTFKGTNPSNPKEKQGELYMEEETRPDSSLVKTDSTKVLSQNLAK